jgi:Spy/CpxP family protein refolding chaperone
MKTILRLILISPVLLFLLSTSVYAHESDPIKEQERLGSELGLTGAQKLKLTEIQAQFKDDLEQKRDAMKAARLDIEKALQGAGPATEIRKKFENLQTAQREFSQKRFEKVLAIRGLLTGEQRQKFQGLRHWRHRDQNHSKE